jgi:hypothetical protein
MKWKIQINSMSSKLSKIIYTIKELSEILPMREIRNIYLTTFDLKIHTA